MNIFKLRHIFVLALLLLGVALGSCMRQDIPESPDMGGGQGKYLKVKLNLPAMKEPSSRTRAMSYEDENRLDQSLLNVIIVKNNVVSKASLVGSVIYDDDDPSKATITAKLPKSVDDNDRIRLCVVANHTIVGSQTDYDAFKAEQLLDVNDKWPTTQPIPMWGESEEIVVNDAMASFSIDMYRALARIDVGLDFTSQDGKLTETVEGLDNFTINSISVHNTKTRMFIAPESVPPVSPNVPSGYDRPGTDPLIYGPLGGADSYVREIYVPENAVPDPFAAADMHCVIVGGFYDGSTIETFYRLEFATENSDTSVSYLPLLRNHRYVFNIVEVTGQGYASRLDAFNGAGAIANRVMNYQLIVLDESIHRVELEGGYFFGLDNRPIEFEPQSGLSTTVRYQTDLPDTEGVTFEWSDQATGNARYDLVLDSATKSFTVVTLTENISGGTYTDTLYVKSGPFSIPIVVRQKSVNSRYAINCGSVAVSGTYVMGEALDGSDYIDLTVTAEDASLQGKTYIIETEEPGGDHGISFAATGTFNLSGSPLTMNIRLMGSGTLSETAGDIPFKLRIKTNSGSGAFCEATIVPVSPVLNIVVMSSNHQHEGYAIDRLAGGSGKVFNNTNNFGPYDYSIIKTAGFNYINDNLYYNFSSYTSSNIYKWVTGIGNGGKIADMVYIAYHVTFNENTAQLLADYLKKGGVIVAFLQGEHYVNYLMDKVFTGYDITTSYTGGVGGKIYPMPGNPAMFADPDGEPRKAVMRQFEGDPILDGPFGDIRDKQIGEDAGYSTYITGGLPTTGAYAEALTIYAYFNNINASPKVTNSTYVLGFRLEEDGDTGRNMFFWGDGGMMSSYSGTPNHSSNTHYPFNWDPTTLFPVPKPVYGNVAANRMPVYNSTMFCNAMGWGIKRSQELRDRRLQYVTP